MPETLTIAEAANVLKISIPTLRRKVRCQEIAYRRVGRLIRFDPADVASYLSACSRPAKATQNQQA